MIILVDQDNVIVDFERALLKQFHAAHPTAPTIAPHLRTTFKVSDQYEPQWHDAFRAISTAPGFFAGLPLIDGAYEGMHALLEAGHDVRICTAPLSTWANCVAEKYASIEATLGPEWVARTILTKDKTLVAGDLLIDDKPHVTGARTPDWVHVRYTHPYNAHLPGPRLTWPTALEVVAGLEAQLGRARPA